MDDNINKFLDLFAEADHESKVIITSRIPVNNSMAIKVGAFKDKEALDYFRKLINFYDLQHLHTELDEKTKQIKFSHNPFSMPQGKIEELDFKDPLNIKAFQYDIVCNGIELSSGAIRNHIPSLMYKLFSIAGYNKSDVDEKFSGMINALSFGAPPHGGIAPGIDRIIMLLANEKNIREVTMFPMNQNAQDLMMNAPSDISESQLDELRLKIIKK